MKNLIGMVVFVLEQHELNKTGWNIYNNIINYAQFLSQKLELWMFVPCKLVDGVWVVLEEPNLYNGDYIFELHDELIGNPVEYNTELFESDLKEYQQAKERCLFDGFELSVGKEALLDNNNTIRIHESSTFSLNGKQVFTIEDLVKYNLELNPTGQKQLSL